MLKLVAVSLLAKEMQKKKIPSLHFGGFQSFRILRHAEDKKCF